MPLTLTKPVAFAASGMVALLWLLHPDLTAVAANIPRCLLLIIAVAAENDHTQLVSILERKVQRHIIDAGPVLTLPAST